MSSSDSDAETLVITALLASEVARVTHGMRDSIELIDDILRLDHESWETTLHVGNIEYHTTRNGPYPNNQMRVSVRPATGVAALHYTDNDDPQMPAALSFNPTPRTPTVYLIFNGDSGAVFPQSAVISVACARAALVEWLRTRKRPICIEWQQFDLYY